MRTSLAVRCVLLVAVAAIAGCGLDVASVVPTGPSILAPSVVTRLVELTNAERLRAGSDTLRSNAQLMQAAQLQANQLAQVDRLDHVLPEAAYPRPEDRLTAAGYAWQIFAENLGSDYTDASRAVEGWMQSPPHRANILGVDHTEIGTGYSLNVAGQPYYVQVFGRPGS